MYAIYIYIDAIDIYIYAIYIYAHTYYRMLIQATASGCSADPPGPLGATEISVVLRIIPFFTGHIVLTGNHDMIQGISKTMCHDFGFKIISYLFCKNHENHIKLGIPDTFGSSLFCT